jgi:hypothetical protein
VTLASNRKNGGHKGKNDQSRAANLQPNTRDARTTRSTAYEAKPTRVEITHQAIAEAAYDLWLREGGDANLNWLKAEVLLRQSAGGR